MAPTRKHTASDHRNGGLKIDRKVRKPLVEKKRRARINDSLHELRALMADTESHSKMENAEVLEMTVKRVESILQNRAQVEAAAVKREACERFAAGYIQCMHDVHTFVSSCPAMDPAVAAELLNHLLESMPLHGQDRLRATLLDADPHPGPWSPAAVAAPGSLVSPAPSADDLSSDLDDIDLEQSQVSSSEESEQSQVSSSEESEVQDAPGCVSLNVSKSVWRPW